MSERIAVIGAGRMGIPIAQTLAAAGYAVDLVDLKPRTEEEWESLALRIRAEWAANAQVLAACVERSRVLDESWQCINLRRGCGPWLRAAAAAFEALPEDAELKVAAYRELGGWLRPDCLVASTTSSLTPDALAAETPHPEQFLVTHWLYPAWVMPLVEVAPGKATVPSAVDEMLAILRRAGKAPVVLAGRPGLAVARLQVLIMNEAARMVEEGLGTAAQIDTAARLGLGFRFLVLGLLEFADAGGVETLYLASRHLRETLDDPKFEPAAPVGQRVQRGDLGQKTGRGFYDWQGSQAQTHRVEALRRYLHLREFLGLGGPEPSDALWP